MQLNLYGFADEANPYLPGQIEALVRNGMQGIELRNVDGGVSCVDLAISRAKEIRNELADCGLRVFSVGSPIGKITLEDDFMAHLDRFRHGLDVARALDCGNMRVFSFYIPQGQEPSAFRQPVMDRLAKLLETAQDSGVTLCHENEKGIYGDSAMRCREIMDAFPQIACVFDPANFVQCGQETWAAWRLLKDRVRYLHVKDALADGRVVPAGKGLGHVARIVKDFLQAGGRDFSMEPHLSVFDGLKSLERAGEQSGVGQVYAYESSDAAFDAACTAFKHLVKEMAL